MKNDSVISSCQVAEEFTPSALSKIKLLARLVKFSHTVFALPFALAMFFIVARSYPVSIKQLLWILLALISARTMAMGFNRIVDRDIDALNPRTKERELPSGQLSLPTVKSVVTVSATLFFISSLMLGVHCLVLAPLVAGILFFYSWTKRFTSYSHIVLGLCLALAPGGVWYALTGKVALAPISMMVAVVFWVAGFDILYSCQDEVFDKNNGLRSFVVRFGVSKALKFSRLFHGLAAFFLVIFGVEAGLGWFYYFGVFLFSIFLMQQHLLVSANDLSRIDAAFFGRNGLASVAYFVAVLGECWWF